MEEIAGFVRTVKYLEIKTIRITHKRPFFIWILSVPEPITSIDFLTSRKN